MVKNDKVIRIQADRLAEDLGLPAMTHFELEELDMIANTDVGQREIKFRGKTVKFTPRVKSIADLLRRKIRG